MNELITLDKVQTEQEEFLNALIETKGENLPAKVEDVLRIFEFTDWKAKAFKSLSDKLSKLDEQSEAYHSALRSGQNWGIAALYAQKRMGELTKPLPKTRKTDEGVLIGRGVAPKAGLSYQTWNEAERMAKHPEILDEAIAAAKKHNDIPTKTSVLNRIMIERAKKSAAEKQEKANDKIDKKRPKAVADYFDAVKIFKNAIGLAKIAAERGKFDPAGKNFLIKKREEIMNLMKEVEDLV